MQSFKSGDRPVDEKNQDMKKALDALSDQDLQHIALYYALQSMNLTRAQTPNGGGAPSEGSPRALRQMSWRRRSRRQPDNAKISPARTLHMIRALRAYKDGTRDDDTMTPRAKKLDDAAMTTLSAYYAELDPKPVNIPRPSSPTSGPRNAIAVMG